MKILLIDDHALFRRGLELLLSDLDTDVEALHASRIEELDPGRHGQTDLILLDMQLVGGLSGLAALSQVRELLPDIPVVVVSGVTDPGLIRQCIEHGAGGFIPKAETPEVLVGALRLVMAGAVYLPSLVLDEIGGRVWSGAIEPDPAAAGVTRHVQDAAVVRHDAGQRPGPGPEGAPADAMSPDAAAAIEALLSPRQLEALMLAVKGKSNKAIARDMAIAEGTVKLHLSAAYRALGVANRTQAVYLVAKVGLRQPRA